MASHVLFRGLREVKETVLSRKDFKIVSLPKFDKNLQKQSEKYRDNSQQNITRVLHKENVSSKESFIQDTLQTLCSKILCLANRSESENIIDSEHTHTDGNSRAALPRRNVSQFKVNERERRCFDGERKRMTTAMLLAQ